MKSLNTGDDEHLFVYLLAICIFSFVYALFLFFLINILLYFISRLLRIISYKWYHIICSLCAWLILLSITFLRFIHYCTCISTSFLFIAECYSICLDVTNFVYPFIIDGYLGVSTFWLLWVVLLWTFVYEYQCLFFSSFV